MCIRDSYKIEKIPGGGITSPRGFKAAGVYCGLKKDNGRNKDLAVIFSESPAVAAGTFTRNLFRAAPVEISQNPVSYTHLDVYKRQVVTGYGTINGRMVYILSLIHI